MPWLARCIGPAVFLALVLRVDLEPVMFAVARIPIHWALLGYSLFVPQLVLRSLRWRILARDQGFNLGFRESFSAYAFSILAGTFTPGRLGEFIKIAHMKAQGYPTIRSTLVVVADRVFDIFVLLAICAIGGPFLLGRPGVIIGLVSLGGIFALVITLRLSRSLRVASRLSASGRTLVNRVAPAQLSAVLDSFGEPATSIGSRTVSESFLFSVSAWFTNYIALFIFAQALGIPVGFLELTVVAAATALAVLVPVSVLGVGTRDLVLVELLAQRGIPPHSALALSVMMLSVLLANALLCSFSLFTPAASLRRYARSGQPERDTEIEPGPSLPL